MVETRRDALTTADIARLCGVSKSTVVRWIEGGKLDAYRTPGGHRRITREALQAFCEAHELPLVDPVSSRRCVMVVDDEPMIRGSMVQLLQLLAPDVPVLTAADAFQAGQLFAQYQPSLVFLDLVLPGMDGFRFYQHLRRAPGGEDATVVVISGAQREDAEGRAARMGIQRFLRKPFTSRAVRKILDEFLPDA